MNACPGSLKESGSKGRGKTMPLVRPVPLELISCPLQTLRVTSRQPSFWKGPFIFEAQTTFSRKRESLPPKRGRSLLKDLPLAQLFLI
jgi:hypothetical protein